MFSFKRFSEQFKILWMQNAQKQGIILVIISLLYVFFHFTMFYSGKNEIYPSFSFWAGFLTVIVIMNSLSVFSDLLKPNASIHYYMVPASIGEKYAAAWLYSSIFTIVLYGAVISLVHYLSMYIGNIITNQSLPLHFPPINWTWKLFFSLMFYQSQFFLAAVLFRKNPFWKMVLTLIIISIIIGLIVVAFLRWYALGSEVFNTNNMSTIRLSMNFQNMNDIILPENYKIIAISIVTSIPIICWIAAYFRLKTREV